MRHTIFKFPFPLFDEVRLMLPAGAKVLTVQMQNGVPQLWAKVNPQNPAEERTFKILATGEPFEDVHLEYIATIQDGGGAFIWHIFEQHRVLKNIYPGMYARDFPAIPEGTA